MEYFKVPFEIANPPFDEDSVPWDGDIASHVIAISKGKAKSLIADHPNDIILTADTVVYCEKKIYGKPKDEEDAFKMLSALSGKWHGVFTGVTVACDGQIYSDYAKTAVLFHELTSEMIQSYIKQLHCLDKAGAYFIQESGGLIVSKIDGGYYNVVGLPMNTVHNLLKKVGLDLWEFLA